MTHYIIVKFNDDINEKRKNILFRENIKNDIINIFSKLKTLSGIKEISVSENIIDRDNRFDVMIKIVMDKEVLTKYDESSAHKEWKSTFGKYIKSKVIFDEE